MAISIDKYVDITSGVGAGAVATTRSLVGRLFTGNPKLPPHTFLTFSSAAEVSAYFGSTSEEAARAAFYFSWVSKNITTPQSIQFARWINEDTAPRIYSARNNNPILADWQSITAGVLDITIGTEEQVLSAMNFAPLTNFTDIAALVQSTINATHAIVEDGTTWGFPQNVISGLSDTAVLSAGMSVTGTGIPGATTVVSIEGVSTIVISNDVTVTGQQTLTFSLTQDCETIDTDDQIVVEDSSLLSVGMAVVGTGIPGSTTISSIDSPTLVTLSNAATATGTPTLTFSLEQDGDLSIPTLIEDLGDTGDLEVGMLVAGLGIPANTTIVSIEDSTSIVISNPSTHTGINVHLSFYEEADAMWAAATVTYNPQTGSFDFVGGEVGVDAPISITPGTGGQDISVIGLLGWFPEAVNNGQGFLIPANGAIWSSGAEAEDITIALQNSADLSNNFGSFLFLNNLALTLDQVVDAATWNAAQNVLYLYTVPVTVAQAQTWPNSFVSLGGVGLTLSPFAGEFPEQIPMMVEAATDYGRENAVQNYMFQIFPGVTPSVTTTAESNGYDAVSVNYYGSTQTAGQIISFYQRGLLQGASNPTNITDMNAYVNEIWLKDAAAVAILNLLLGLGQVGANAQGRSQILATLQQVIDLALLNGTISVGKILSTTQQAFITNETGDSNAWYQVQSAGYWVDCQIIPIPDVSPTQYEADYTLIYSKDDVIRKVVGTQTLI